MPFAPGVRQIEQNDSLYASASSGCAAACVGTAHKGPYTVSLITTPAEYIDVYGSPTTQMGYFALQYLRRGNALYVERIADASAAASTVNVPCVSVDIFSVTAKTDGTWGDDLSCRVYAATDLNVAHINLEILLNDVVVERYYNITSFADLETLEDSSEYVDFAQVGAAVWPVSWAADYASYDLTGGDSGTAALVDADYTGTIGVPPVSTSTGLHAFDESTEFPIDIVAIPGYATTATATALIALAESRQDCLALVSLPDNLSIDHAMEWVNGTYVGHGADQTTVLNSSYAAAFYPWHKYLDEVSADYVYIDAVGPAAAVIANSEFMENAWAAPAGRKRGYHPYTTDLRISPTNGDLAKAYGMDGQNLNLFQKQRGFGIVLWGQKTLHRTNDALNRINVRRLLNVSKRALEEAAMSYVFAPSDAQTWGAIIDIGTSILGPIKASRGLYDYRVICDASVNTPDVIDRNEIRAKIMIKPTKTAEWLVFTWVITNTGATL
jgi:uncharacterized protein